MTNIKRIIIRKSGEQIETNIYILIFNQLHITKVKIGYCLQRVQQYIQTPMRYVKCKKYGHHWEACGGCVKRGEKGLDHTEEEC